MVVLPLPAGPVSSRRPEVPRKKRSNSTQTPSGNSSSRNAGAFDCHYDAFYATTQDGSGNTRLVTVDLSSGLITDIGPTTSKMDAIDFQCP